MPVTATSVPGGGGGVGGGGGRGAGRIPAEDDQRIGTRHQPSDRLRAERDASRRVLQADGEAARDVLIADVRHRYADVDRVSHDDRTSSSESRYGNVGDRGSDGDRE